MNLAGYQFGIHLADEETDPLAERQLRSNIIYLPVSSSQPATFDQI